ncbi:MAG: VCBS repeat-containing protein [Anaerolineae bacterium]|nr:VCBS repeat-containing protein [Anaerolineae bacterium]
MTHQAQSAQAGNAQEKPSGFRRHRNWVVVGVLGGIMGLIILTPLLLSAWIVTLDNQGTFHNTTDSADFDGDGDLDVLLHNVRTESEFTAFGGPTLWWNQGNGQFSASHLQQPAGEAGGWASAAGDFDLDGDFDLAIFMGHHLRLQMNQGGAQEGQMGVFNRGVALSGPEENGQYGTFIVGDLDSDGWVDGVVVGCCGRIFTLKNDDDTPNVSGVWLNKWGEGNGPGQMVELSALDGLAIRAAQLGDLDGDGDLDLFAAVMAPNTGRHTDSADRIILNDGAGNFTDSGQRLGTSDSTAVALGDLDGDGDLDAIVGSVQGAHMWLNQGRAQGGQEGKFVFATQSLGSEYVANLFLNDFDQDGDLDVLLGSATRAHIWWNNGQAALSQANQRLHYSKRDGLAVGDFDGNGLADIFTAAYNDSYRVWFNRGNGIFRP